MTRPERMDADFRGTGLTIGRHPVAYHRAELNKLGACRAIDMQQMRDGSAIKVGGWVIVQAAARHRQRICVFDYGR